MRVILFNESTDKAWRVTRRIASRFLPQVASRCWMGRASMEMIAELRDELRTCGYTATRSVACYQLVNNRVQKPLFIDDSPGNFTTDGFAFSVPGHSPRPTVRPLSPVAELLRALTRLAALLHDLGKCTVEFQNILLGLHRDGNARLRSSFRHEALSAELFARVCCTPNARGRIYAGEASDDDWLNGSLEDPKTVRERFDALLDNPSDEMTGLTPNPDDMGDRFADFLRDAFCEDESASLLCSVLWLVCSHHKMPHHSDGEISLDNLVRDFHGPDALGVATQKLDGLPWRDERWLSALCSTLRRIRELREHAPLDDPLWSSLLAHVARPLLMYADHHASSRPKAKRGRPPKHTIFARSKRDAKGKNKTDHKGRVILEDPLTDHLLSVRRKVTFYFARAWQNVWQLPHVESSTLVPDSPLLDPTPPDRFAWQVESERAVRRAMAEPGALFFGALIATTGSGKTIGGARIIKGLNPAMRFTYAVGLRTLAAQTGAAYSRDLRLGPHQLCTIIGNTVQEPYQVTNPGAASETEFDEETGHPDYFAQAGVSETYELDIPSQVIGGEVTASLIAAPVLAATVDHIVHCTELLTGGPVSPYLRTAHADLILDEIDGYDPRDLPGLGKLVFLHALHGRRVLLMSATMNPATYGGLLHAYERGRAARQLLTGERQPMFTGFFSDLTEPQIDYLENLGDPKSAFTEFVARHLGGLSPWRGVGVAEMEKTDDGSVLHEQIFAQCLRLHELHREIDPVTGRGLTLGFVRFNTVKRTRAFARFLFERKSDEGEPALRAQCYHAKMWGTHRKHLESRLDVILNRSDPSRLFVHPEVRTTLDDGGEGDCLVIISTTSVQETGRDHDYHWSVLEPASARSMVQSAGRVGRHRRELPEGEYVTLLPGSLSDGSRAWSRPGIEDYSCSVAVTRPPSKPMIELLENAGIRVNSNEAGKKKPPPIRDTREAFGEICPSPDEAFLPITPRPCLVQPATYEAAPLAAAEHAVSHDALRHLESYFSSLRQPLHSAHAREWAFRKEDGARVTLARDEEGGIYIVREKGDTSARVRLAQTEELLPCNKPLIDIPAEEDMDWLTALPERSREALATVSVTMHGIHSPSQAREKLRSSADSRLEYDPLLGFG